MNKYTKDGYVESGYIEGGGFVAPDAGQHPMKFFVSNGTKSLDELTSIITSLLDDGDMAILYAPEFQKIMLGSKSGFDEFLGGIDINSILTNQAFIDKVTELASFSMSASIVANDGSIVANATVTQIDETTFDVTVPPELVGTSYKIKLNKTN